MNILVTGATSLIGRHVVQRLIERGDKIAVLQRHCSGLAGVQEICCDIADPQHALIPEAGSSDSQPLETAMEGKDAIIHLAAKVSIAGRWEDFEAINIRGVQQLVNTAKRCGVASFIHVSTPSVAHAGRSLIGAPAGPADPVNARGHYARSKALGEQLVLAANSATLKVVALRPHLVWGPGDTQLVERVIQRARAGRLVLVGSGLALIDTTYIDNAAEAIVAAVDNIDRAAGCALVISNGQPRTVSEILHRIIKTAGLSPDLRKVPAQCAIAAGSAIEHIWEALDKSDDPPMTRFLAEQLATAHWFDQRDTQRLLNWQPRIGIEEGFERLAAAD